MQENPAEVLSQLADDDYCYLTTQGRVSGRPHEIEIWFGTQGGARIYLMAGNHRSDWVLNSLQEPRVMVRITKHWFDGTVHVVKDEDEEMNARYLLAEKYQEWEEGRTLSDWARTALVVAIDLSLAESE